MTVSAVLIYACLGLSLAGCTLNEAQTGPQAWIDAPLSGSAFPVNSSIEVTSHSSDLAGISRVELSANNSVVGSDAVPGSGDTYVLMKQNWTPTQAGNYQLRVRSRNANGQWSTYAIVMVTVERAIVVPTIQAAPTATATQNAPVPPAPPSASTDAVSIESVSTNSVYLGDASCGPPEVTITARATAQKGIAVVVLFYRLSGNSSNAFESVNMNPMGGDLYSRTLNPTSLFGDSAAFEQTALQYQVVVQQNGGDTSLRTPVFADIAIQPCGNAPTLACSSYTDKRSCQSHGCSWASKPGTVPTFECKNP
jgi:hypothetical protein